MKWRATLLTALAGMLLLLALALAGKGISYAATAGDAMFEPEQVCNSACKDQWKIYGERGGLWMDGSLLSVCCAVGVAVVVYRGIQRERLR